MTKCDRNATGSPLNTEFPPDLDKVSTPKRKGGSAAERKVSSSLLVFTGYEFGSVDDQYHLIFLLQ